MPRPAASPVSYFPARRAVGRILAKIDARDRVQAVIFAYDTRLVRPA
jgi:hypothetical protein